MDDGTGVQRKLLVCTGPPLDRKNDVFLAEKVAAYKGDILICGGTTARIIARELGREINVVLRPDPARLPPVSKMEGVSLITEGVLTLEKVKKLLEKAAPDLFPMGKGTDVRVAQMLLDHDNIEFMVGTAINQKHRDPQLPVELELRRNLICELGKILENGFTKKIKIEYI